MSREDQHFRLRLPADLREKVEAAATESRRSLTAEILERLEASFASKTEGYGPEILSYIQKKLDDIDNKRRVEAQEASDKIERLVTLLKNMEENIAVVYKFAADKGDLDRELTENILSKLREMKNISEDEKRDIIDKILRVVGGTPAEADPTTPSTPTPKRPSRTR